MAIRSVGGPGVGGAPSAAKPSRSVQLHRRVAAHDPERQRQAGLGGFDLGEPQQGSAEAGALSRWNDRNPREVKLVPAIADGQDADPLGGDQDDAARERFVGIAPLLLLVPALERFNQRAHRRQAERPDKGAIGVGGGPEVEIHARGAIPGSWARIDGCCPRRPYRLEA